MNTMHRRSMKILGKVIQNTEYAAEHREESNCANCFIIQPGAFQTLRTRDTLTSVTARQTKKVKDQSVVRAMLIAVKVRLSISVEQI